MASWARPRTAATIDRRAVGTYNSVFLILAAAVLAEEPRKVWRQEVFATLAHEFTHHLEEDAGTHRLDDRDAQFLRDALAELTDGAPDRSPPDPE